MRRVLLISLLVSLLAGGLYASDCGNGLPCGKLGWTLPSFPVLNSPTPMPTIQITSIPASTAAPTGAPSPTPAPTGTIMADFSSLGDQLKTLQAVVEATAEPVEVSGTPVSMDNQFTTLGADAGTFFGYLRGVSSINLGGWTPFISFLIVGFVVFLSMKSIGFFLPVIAVIFRLLLRIIEIVKKLIGL